jgi:hypothetical protein
VASGLAIPVRAHKGRAVLTTGAEQMAKIVTLAMADGDSANPYNDDAGLDVPVFDLDSTALRALVQRGIGQSFARWEADDRAKLVSVAFTGAPGDLQVAVDFVDLETDQPQQVQRSVRRG